MPRRRRRPHAVRPAAHRARRDRRPAAPWRPTRRTRGRGLNVGREMLARAEARLLHQFLRRRLVVFDLEGRLATPGMTWLEGAGRRHHQSAKQAVLQALAVNAEIGGFAHADIIPGRALDARELPRPDVRLLGAVDQEAALI